jgi:hypothetical protein
LIFQELSILISFNVNFYQPSYNLNKELWLLLFAARVSLRASPPSIQLTVCLFPYLLRLQKVDVDSDEHMDSETASRPFRPKKLDAESGACTEPEKTPGLLRTDGESNTLTEPAKTPLPLRARNTNAASDAHIEPEKRISNSQEVRNPGNSPAMSALPPKCFNCNRFHGHRAAHAAESAIFCRGRKTLTCKPRSFRLMRLSREIRYQILALLLYKPVIKIQDAGNEVEDYRPLHIETNSVRGLENQVIRTCRELLLEGRVGAAWDEYVRDSATREVGQEFLSHIGKINVRFLRHLTFPRVDVCRILAAGEKEQVKYKFEDVVDSGAREEQDMSFHFRLPIGRVCILSLRIVRRVDIQFLGPPETLKVVDTDILLKMWLQAWKTGRVSIRDVEEMVMMVLRLNVKRYGGERCHRSQGKFFMAMIKVSVG